MYIMSLLRVGLGCLNVDLSLYMIYLLYMGSGGLNVHLRISFQLIDLQGQSM